ncbi:hypothetical protein L1049_003520 [Liquidambar formosana]|uniref:Uncharacterized protein n=1 Tax=Liquidambar formosana TaxID=63359 RepID=A0AAP0N547_LIQFO
MENGQWIYQGSDVAEVREVAFTRRKGFLFQTIFTNLGISSPSRPYSLSYDFYSKYGYHLIVHPWKCSCARVVGYERDFDDDMKRKKPHSRYEILCRKNVKQMATRKGFFTLQDMDGVCDSDFVDDLQGSEGVVGDLDGPQESGIKDTQGK